MRWMRSTDVGHGFFLDLDRTTHRLSWVLEIDKDSQIWTDSGRGWAAS